MSNYILLYKTISKIQRSKAENANEYTQLVAYLKMARKTIKEPQLDTQLIYALAKVNKLGDLEEPISVPNVAKIDQIGEMDMSVLMKIKELYFDGDMNAAPALSGQSVGLIDKVKNVKDIIDETINEFNKVCKDMGQIKF